LPFMKNRSACLSWKKVQLASHEKPFSLPFMKNRPACIEFLNEKERHGEMSQLKGATLCHLVATNTHRI
jgi:hypothetical protein